nr:hypothetical protein [uncultured Dongia sp.]
MRPPMSKRVEDRLSEGPAADSKSEGYAEKVKLAEHLHAQGINPLRWTEAHPAPQGAQQHFQKTGRKGRDDQFEVGGRLYDWAPGISATPAQAKAIAEAYIATPHDPPASRPGSYLAPIEELMDVTQVPLKHPLGTPHLSRTGSARPDLTRDEERLALYRHYADAGIDPANAHLGDPLPMTDQVKIKTEMAKLLPSDKTEISGLPMFYQGFDDGWIYTPNKFTQETPDVQKIRLAHAEKQVQPRDDRAPVAVNDNDAGMIDEIIAHYSARDHVDAPSANKQLPKPSSDMARDALARNQLEEMSGWMPSLVSLVEKAQAGQALTPEETSLLVQVQRRFAEIDILFDPKNANLENLREAAKAVEHASLRKDSKTPLHLVALGVNAGVATALANGTMDWARLGQIGWAEGLRQSLDLLKNGRVRNALGGLTTAVVATDALVNPKDDDMVDLLSIPGKWAQAALTTISSTGTNAEADEDSNSEVITSTEQGQRQKILTPATPQTLKALRTGLADASTVQIWIGGEPLFKQGEHKTLMDNIFREEFIKVAQEKGCLPNPNDPEDKRSVREYGGDKSQKRITDTDQPGHLGSRQTDGAVEWTNFDGTTTETHWGSTTPRADGFTETTREWRALQDTVVKIKKHLDMGAENMAQLLELTKNPVKGQGPVYYMSEKRSWNVDDLRNFIRKKLRERFDKDFRDCKFIGESRLVKLDDPNDPDLPQKP